MFAFCYRGFAKIRKCKNETFGSDPSFEAGSSGAGSARYERNAQKEQRKWLKELEQQYGGEDEAEEEKNQVSRMTLPDLSPCSCRARSR